MSLNQKYNRQTQTTERNAISDLTSADPQAYQKHENDR